MWGVNRWLSARFDVIMLGVATILSFAIVGLAEDLFALPPTVRFMLQLGLGVSTGLRADSCLARVSGKQATRLALYSVSIWWQYRHFPAEFQHNQHILLLTRPSSPQS